MRSRRCLPGFLIGAEERCHGQHVVAELEAVVGDKRKLT